MSDFDGMNYEESWPKPQGIQMAHHALSFLTLAKGTDPFRKTSDNRSVKFNAIILNLLSCTIQESLDRFGCWGMAQAFWKSISECHPDAPKLVAQLYNNNCGPEIFKDTVVGSDTSDMSPITQMAAEVFTHLCVPFMNPCDLRPTPDTPEMIPEPTENAVDRILAEYATTEPWGQRRQQVLKKLVYLRDGGHCPLTRLTFKGFSIPYYSKAALCHIIPNCIASPNKPDPFRMISLFAGTDVAESVRAELNSLGNVVNLDTGISVVFDDLMFGIEAEEENTEVQYYFRYAPGHPFLEDNPFRIQPNGRIPFGAGPFGEKLGRGPNPNLCNLHWAIVRVMTMSGAAEIFREERDEQLENPSALLSVHYINAQLDKFAMEREMVS
ncbi:hypothetical protein ARMSODRAFT_1008925 [Armillaria solidipes]|uniref:HNH nuclease domain-containing protein n=1 Tax=Armillaria solidipes TaxID=1076256 RepID=A0A2H3B2B5_9AGAR|nr:hypothetical protein ARMSODRAFT_1008925 [Armillaria solidipes]